MIFSPRIKIYQSPNTYPRACAIEGVVLHYTGGGSARATAKNWFGIPQSQVSAHYVVGRMGDIYQCASLNQIAWHAGRSEMLFNGEMRSGANKYTIGIELANYGLLTEDDGHFYYERAGRLKKYKEEGRPQEAQIIYDTGYEITGYWEPYYPKQIQALKDLLRHISDFGWQKAVKWMAGHESVAMPLGRKSDPGPLFPWGVFTSLYPQRTQSIISS